MRTNVAEEFALQNAASGEHYTNRNGKTSTVK